MDKRYQVFVSSTFADLQEERSRVIQTLMEMDCIPAGMELFPAADEEQWEFIKKVINDCDYYLLIIGGRYGTVTDAGISYTEMEYDYAVSIGLKVIALIHEAPESIPAGKSELTEELRDKLNAFRERVSEGRLVKFWREAKDLPGQVALSLSKTIKMHPAVGWVRANEELSHDLLIEINNLRKQVSANAPSTRSEIEPKATNVAPLSSVYEFTLKAYADNYQQSFNISISWLDLFKLMSPHMLDEPEDNRLKRDIGHLLLVRQGEEKLEHPLIDHLAYRQITVQLCVHGLIDSKLKRVDKNDILHWYLTKQGRELMFQEVSIKTE